MSKVQMIRRNRVFNVDARLAPLLERRAGYLRRDMQAELIQSISAKKGPAATGKAQGDGKAKSGAKGSDKKPKKSPGKTRSPDERGHGSAKVEEASE